MSCTFNVFMLFYCYDDDDDDDDEANIYIERFYSIVSRIIPRRRTHRCRELEIMKLNDVHSLKKRNKNLKKKKK